ncbi:hypothetical protein Nepgr_004300 [Nepenthes gracilis]|uniref:Uncharacterized protein n=1 Tax=Nepenthes gracilis TaxID=150966 RepID=A0AAD3XF58_NEPGR|nr:hypothetical protein Nepgr_004300 [Nepenthes gracilis]
MESENCSGDAEKSRIYLELKPEGQRQKSWRMAMMSATAKELRLLTKKTSSSRALYGESANAIPQLLRPLSQRTVGDEIHPDLQEDLITTLVNLPIHDGNKKHVAENPITFLLVDAMKSGTIQTRSNVAAVLFTLSSPDSNKALIGSSSTLGSLIVLLDDGHLLAMNDAASANFDLSMIHENKDMAGQCVILKKKQADSCVDELLEILTMPSTHQKVVEELGEIGADQCLLPIIRETPCDQTKENCIAILHPLSMNDQIKLRETRQKENAFGTLSQLARDETLRAKKKKNRWHTRKPNVPVNLTYIV